MDAEVSLARRIRELARTHPEDAVYRQIALDGSAATFTWGWLDRRSSQLAGALAARGLGRGDFLALGLHNSPRLVLSVFAAWKLGAIPVPVRWDLPDWELGRVRDVIQPRVYLGAEDNAWVDATAELAVPELPDAVSPHRHGICSSGSTGTPKVILAGTASTFNPHYGSPLMEGWRPVPRPQHIMVPAPMYHVTAFSMLYVMLAGDRLTVLEKFDATRALDVIERYRVSHFIATPTMLQRMADLPGVEARDLSSLEWINQGAAPMPPSLVHRWAKLIGAGRILMSYGMSEGLGLTALTGDEWMAHQGSVGRPLRGTQVRVLDGAGNDMPLGEVGEIYLRSASLPSAGARYLGDVPPPRGTADGFKTVGDLGYLDEDGYLYLVDRRVDMIVTGGANVFPAEVEMALIDHPKVADVVVIGLRDPEWGRRVHAVIEAADHSDPPTLEDIRAFAKDRLAAYKVPKTIEIVGAIPRSEATKVSRGRLVEARGG
ncbi:AMP-binding protein [Pseudofrankia sp. DC12]|uniref:class I adenylate-forming enzyme family protein n=1 Tax=Pseudofrankia sp. DC12 TaxID=683315 RepID=UPI0005F7A248|nr:AMP-binding protein [Pseudofrankia sp. DC12]